MDGQPWDYQTAGQIRNVIVHFYHSVGLQVGSSLSGWRARRRIERQGNTSTLSAGRCCISSHAGRILTSRAPNTRSRSSECIAHGSGCRDCRYSLTSDPPYSHQLREPDNNTTKSTGLCWCHLSFLWVRADE